MISAYDARWPGRADALLAELRVALGPDALRIDHIGSTAIPGMDAKDLLDLQVSVADLELAAEHFDGPLERMHFQRSPYDRDHVPAGRADDPSSWTKRLWSRRDHADGDVVRRVQADPRHPGSRCRLVLGREGPGRRPGDRGRRGMRLSHRVCTGTVDRRDP